MRLRPRLVPIPPTPGDAQAIETTPFWIGASSTAHLKVYLPGIAERHASITEREDGYYIAPHSAATMVTVNGDRITSAERLKDHSEIGIGAVARFEVVTGEPRRQAPVEAPKPEPEFLPDRKVPWWKRRRRKHGRRAVGFPVWGWILAGAIGVAMMFVGVQVYRLVAAAGQDPVPPPALTPFEGRLYDSLMVEATTHIERGATLLDLGARDQAGRELAAAVTGFDQSIIRDNPWVQQGVNALRKTVEELYRSKSIALPAGWTPAPKKVFNLSANLSANLDADQFLSAVDEVRAAFAQAYRDTIVVTGRDHPEHVSLYGSRSAMDIRVRGLRPDQVQFLVKGFADRRIRVKDFSSDQVLRAQIAAAIRAGVPDRAGTGVHLHVDRYRDRNDRWTVRR
ncbi:MAG: FHA domain-containing protein, partial [Cytophagaceae bacterium]|nr:FHA domain-containing protein [Gemmatimonadaceae bacterium]